ncbi:hypothetical protein B0H14DRAFT_3890879 [Mycena olivaceomarginata]|nr:hypothetical protein B0H14DRAFT_3890879 [Mycena olivaceomarginata]
MPDHVEKADISRVPVKHKSDKSSVQYRSKGISFEVKNCVMMAVLTEHEVYVKKEGRVLDDDKLPVPDVSFRRCSRPHARSAAGQLGASAHAEDRALGPSQQYPTHSRRSFPAMNLTWDHDQLPDILPAILPDDADDEEQPEVDEDLFCGVTNLDLFGFGGRRPRYGRRLGA